MLIPARGPEHALLLAIPSTTAFPPLSPPPTCGRHCSGLPRYYAAVRLSHPPRQLRLLDFLSWPAITAATTGGMRSPRFRRVPFVRDVALDQGPRVLDVKDFPDAGLM